MNPSLASRTITEQEWTQIRSALEAIWAGVPDKLRERLDSYPDEQLFHIPAMVGGLRRLRDAVAATRPGGMFEV